MKRPSCNLTETLVGIWQEVLGCESIGIHDNFFDLGGHSLLLVRVRSHVRERTARDLMLVDLFRYPTIAALAEHLGGEQLDSPNVGWEDQPRIVTSPRSDLVRAQKVLSALSLVVPRRLRQEEISDALECIHRLVGLGRPSRQIWIKVGTTVFWVLLNALREVSSAVRGRASAKP